MAVINVNELVKQKEYDFLRKRSNWEIISYF